MGPVLRKELGEQFVAAGLVGAAMELFEELELWDALILCYRLLQKDVQAEELVRKRLEVGHACLFHVRISSLWDGRLECVLESPCSAAAARCMCQSETGNVRRGRGVSDSQSSHACLALFTLPVLAIMSWSRPCASV